MESLQEGEREVPENHSDEAGLVCFFRGGGGKEREEAP